MWAARDIQIEGPIVLSQSGLLQREREVVAGLRAAGQAMLPAWMLYDDRGCELFDRICRTPEYYPTRVESELLALVAHDVAKKTQAAELLELGAGHARKTHLLLDALEADRRLLRYVPLDVSPGVIRACAQRLVQRYPALRVRGLVGDFTADLDRIPPGTCRLVAFLGGTIGNFDLRESATFLGGIARLLGPADWFLLGADLVKDRAALHAAYNDRAGITAQFNMNVLSRLHDEFGIDVDPDDFVHDAFFSEEHSRIEMHVRAKHCTLLCSARLRLARAFDTGESIRTEISRKFTCAQLVEMHAAAGLRVEACYQAKTPYALILSRRA